MALGVGLLLGSRVGRMRRSGIRAGLFAFGLFVWGWGYALWRMAADRSPLPQGCIGSVALEFRVLDAPREKGTSARFRVQVIAWQSNTTGKGGAQSFDLWGSAQGIEPGFWVPGARYRTVLAWCKPLEFNKNPHAFNYGQFLERKGVAGTVRIDRMATVRLSDSPSLARAPLRFSEWIIGRIRAQPLSAPASGFLEAFLFARKDRVDPELLDRFSNSGTIHILAVSGLHVGMLYALLRWVFRSGKPGWVGLRLGVVWLYALCTGFSPSVVRAGTMLTLAEVLGASGRTLRKGQVWLGSAFLLLLFNPSWIFDLGFQLSFGAVAGLIWIRPMAIGLWPQPPRGLGWMRDALATSISAQLACLPLLLPVFGQFPLLFLPSNLAAVPLSGFLMYAALPLLTLGAFVRVPAWAWWPVERLFTALTRVVEWGGNPDYALARGVFLDPFGAGLLGMVLVVGVLTQARNRRTMWKWGAMCSLLGLAHGAHHQWMLRQGVRCTVHQSQRGWAVSLIDRNRAFWWGTIDSIDYRFAVLPGFERARVKSIRHIPMDSVCNGLGWGYERGLLMLGNQCWALPPSGIGEESAQKLGWDCLVTAPGDTPKWVQAKGVTIDLTLQAFTATAARSP